MATDSKVIIIQNSEVARGVYKLVMQASEVPPIHGGQFMQIKVPDNSFILRRPICISDFDYQKNTVTAVYAVRGKGTRRLSEAKPGEMLQVLFPLGNGFKIEPGQKKVMLLGGGMGSVIFPSVMREYPDKEFYVYLGFADKDLIVNDERYADAKKSVFTTDDGSNGNGGFITDKVVEDLDRISPDLVLSCGPTALYRTMKKVFADFKNPVMVSLEGHMCCGIGACYVCACKIKKGGNVYTMRVCKDGPAFNLNEVEL